MVKRAHRPKVSNTRKAIRKEKRQEKKLHRKEHYMKKKPPQCESKFPSGSFVKRPADEHEPSSQPEKKKKQSQLTSNNIIIKERQKDQKEVQRLNSQINKQRRKMLLKANEDEDKMIKKLEKQLGLNKSKNKNNYFTDDGLDYLLEICDKTTSEQIVAAEKHLADMENESDFEEDLAAVTGKEVKQVDIKKQGKKSKNKAEDSQSENSYASGDEMDDYESNDGSSENGDEESIESENGDNGSTSNIADDSELDETDEEPQEKPTNSTRTATKTKLNVIQNQTTKKFETKSKFEKKVKAEDLSKVFSDDEVSHLSGDDDLGGFSGNKIGDEERQVEEKSKTKPDVWEDIYGRKRDNEGNVIKEEKGVYIPPHLRNKGNASDKEMTQLKRQIKSVLNKLSGSNLHWACTSVENLYQQHSRHSVNEVLWAVWAEGTVGAVIAPARLQAEHAAMLAVVHANVGEEVGAYFLQELTKSFDSLMKTPQSIEDKTLDNVICCLSHLYNFKIYHGRLMFDILSRLMERVSEKSIECVLAALRTVGGALRKGAPAQLSQFIHDTQRAVREEGHNAAVGSRVKFLIEMLMAVKNNNLTKIPNYDPEYPEQLKKTIRSIIRKGNYVTPLNISLEDLLKADERGKWWVVGSAWEGSKQAEVKPEAAPPAAERTLLELARKQRMNTDVRRNIFCVIMAAEDYMSAFEKLEQLGLRGPQQREVSHVVLACCLQEKTYNPYYGVLANKLASTDRKYQLSFQFAIWDKIKDLDSLQKHALCNLAQLIVQLTVDKGLPLSILKIIQFSDLTKRTVKFMRQILLAIIMNEDLQSTLEVFHRISKSPKLHMFRESLRLFIQHFLVKNAERKSTVLSEADMAVLKQRSAEIDKILTLHDNKMML